MTDINDIEYSHFITLQNDNNINMDYDESSSSSLTSSPSSSPSNPLEIINEENNNIISLQDQNEFDSSSLSSTLSSLSTTITPATTTIQITPMTIKTTTKTKMTFFTDDYIINTHNNNNNNILQLEWNHHNSNNKYDIINDNHYQNHHYNHQNNHNIHNHYHHHHNNLSQHHQDQVQDKIIKWKKHCKHGTFLEGTKIIPTKVFLMDEKWEPYLQAEERYTIFDLLDYTHKLGIKIDAIIDINRSLDYYSMPTLQAIYPELAKIKYFKFKVDTDIPDDELINQIHETIKNCHERNEAIAIHCFNGLNRTGFLLVDFLCRYFGYSLEKSINIFEKARGHDIENKKLKNGLIERFA